MPTRAAFPARRTTPDARLALLACLALCLGAAGLAGCAASPSYPPAPSLSPPAINSPGILTHYTPNPAALQDSANCPANASWLLHGDQPAAAVKDLMGSVPAGFVPVAVVECNRGPVPTSAGASPVQPTIVEDHLSGDYAPLLAALAVSSDRQDGVNCTAQLEVTPDLWLVNAAGKAVHVIWPTDACTFSKPGVAKALAALHVASTQQLEIPVAP
ncbi:hypothetical protein CVV68_17330 [Arthrobacter livingstonensis]|uniref:DUF3558 domain-containing protein n=1 Tax=Arthrobacter livingstonensis TaxID=670078 RepID=A0A2V5L2Z7_9MICC|nr:hypothetical protein [Arthrobacter livingstonensis]PYI65639.1 hypothetical protein CVV68_17330 [Arthrobacter livingstonensis]